MKILVLGASGMIGHRMWATLSQLHDVRGAVRRDSLGPLSLIPGIDPNKCYYKVDAYQFDSVQKVLRDFKPDVVLNCIGIVKQLKDSNDHIKSISLNALFPHQLAKACHEINARMIQFSSDCVFDGFKGNYIETDFQDAKDLYGKSKALGEVNYLENTVTMRTSTIGREVFPHGGLLEWFLGNEGGKVTGYKKAIYSGFPAHRLALIISQYILPNTQLKGVFHIASQPINKFDLLKMIADKFKLNIEIGSNDSVSVERSLNCDQFCKETGFHPLSWSEMMKDLEIDFQVYQKIRKQN